MDNFNLTKYLKNNSLNENEETAEEVVDALQDEMDDILDGIEDKLELASEKQQSTNEGLLTIVSIGLALPAILGLIARIGKKAGKVVNSMLGSKPTEKEEEEQWFAKLGKIADDLHHLYMIPLEKLFSKFIKDPKKAKKAANIMFHVIIAILLVASGTTAVKAIQSKNISFATLEGALTAIKGGELSAFVSNALEIVSDTGEMSNIDI
jgi:hypothetical protein